VFELLTLPAGLLELKSEPCQHEKNAGRVEKFAPEGGFTLQIVEDF